MAVSPSGNRPTAVSPAVNRPVAAGPLKNRPTAVNSMGNGQENRTPTGRIAGKRKMGQGLSLTKRGPVSWGK